MTPNKIQEIRDKAAVIRNRLRYEKMAKDMENFFLFLPEISFIEYTDDKTIGVSLSNIWSEILSYDSHPVSSISIKLEAAKCDVWLQECFKKTGIKNYCYLSLAEFPYLPWCKIRINNFDQWLIALWGKLQNVDLVVCSVEKNVIFGLIEEEYDYEVYVISI